MPHRPVRTMYAALLAASVAPCAAALTTAPASAPYAPLVLAGGVPAAPGSIGASGSFAAGAGVASAPGHRSYTASPSAPAGMEAAALPAWHDLLPDAGTGPALLIGLLAVAFALLRMVHNRR